MEFEYIIDSHCHWGPSITLGIDITTKELQNQMKQSGVTHVFIIPFPSTAIDNNEINVRLLEETKKIKDFIPYHYIREDYDIEGFDPIPEGYYGGKWHWMRGWQDSASNYKVLEDKALPGLIEKIKKTNKPVIFEEELRFTEIFVEMAEGMKIIIPHLGLLGGNPMSFLKSFKEKENVYFDTALASQNEILKFVETVGPHRVIFGSDVPFGNMKHELSKVLNLPISYIDKELLLFKNIARITGLII
ncbi:MAG TPA: amidohydrolase family protein [Syntrophorhabdaceae bacterium]|nr:amidohydrolase family protein [Syntrophorhabdaceae bacterium]